MSRTKIISKLQQASQANDNARNWDVIIIGGGITGAGILLAACQAGLKALLIEQRDFAWGASSKSSKMVHGGLRYLGSGQYKMTKDAVTERQKLLRELPGLVTPLQFLMGHYKRQFPGPMIFNTLLSIYDWIGGQHNHSYINHNVNDFYAPGMRQHNLRGVTQFADAVTDDARLVLRILQEAQDFGGTAINYVAAKQLLQRAGKVTGVTARDEISGEQFELTANVVISATGPWTDKLRQLVQADKAIRPLRGSHLIVPSWRLPLAYSVSYFHPDDKRPIFAFPWEHVTVIGTTDLDHDSELNQEPSISQDEVDYLLAGINRQFPQADIQESDIIASYAGLRPVVSKNKDPASTKPSDEKREHSIWDDNGLISVAGGKLTTFRLIANDALTAAQPYLGQLALTSSEQPFFQPVAAQVSTPTLEQPPLYPQQLLRLKSSYGKYYAPLLSRASSADLTTLAATNTLLAEVKWSLEHELVVHLDDLLLRRTRLGLLLPQGAAALFSQLKPLCQLALRWNEQQWQQELTRYQGIIVRYYSLPSRQRRYQATATAAQEV